ncbi:MAG: glycoside hydrolase family 16 protein [Balneolaceae bacterium]|nr:glycoside hydrolase family 16 protein [Balneolaceae bacterium]
MYSRTALSTLLLLFFILFSCDSSTSIDNGDNNNGPDPTDPTEREWQLVWSDEFDDDELDMSKWSYQIGTGASEGLTGWGNNELQYYTDREENVFIEDGKLHIVAHREDYNGMRYTSGRLRTMNKGDWKYGRIEVRAKSPKGQGIWPAIWMLPTYNAYGGWPKSGEIDIMELVGHEPETIHGTVHFGPDWPHNRNIGTDVSLDEGTFADDFYTFSIEWKQNEIKWFLDDEHFFTVTPSDLSPDNYPFNEDFHLLINLAVGGFWPGNPDQTTEFPQSFIIDYVRVYQYL